jgi:uncharacterized protein YndB with AHSA1/START domain
MDAKVDKTLKITTPSELEIVMTRTFDAPRHLVFDAMTKPEHLQRWFGCAEAPLRICEIDLRVGGAYRFVMGSPGSECTLQGIYREISSPELVVFTETFSMPGFTGSEYRVATTFEDVGGKTRMTTSILHSTKEARDGHLGGIDQGVSSAYDRLAAFVESQA